MSEIKRPTPGETTVPFMWSHRMRGAMQKELEALRAYQKYLAELWAAGHPDRDGIRRAIFDYSAEEVFLMLELAG